MAGSASSSCFIVGGVVYPLTKHRRQEEQEKDNKDDHTGDSAHHEIGFTGSGIALDHPAVTHMPAHGREEDIQDRKQYEKNSENNNHFDQLLYPFTSTRCMKLHIYGCK